MLDLSEVRFTLDEVCNNYPSRKHGLSPNATIVHNPSFESAVKKIINCHECDMNEDEREATLSSKTADEIESIENVDALL